MNSYPVPAENHRQERIVRRSRFISSIAQARDVPAAMGFIDAIRAEFPDASHHCYAYVVGPPGDTSRVGMSDAGEPRGTAGRPMLTVLLHAGVGDVAVVVSRYFGGTKLGTGGLVRAYSSAVQQALATLPLRDFEPTVDYDLVADYAHYDVLNRWLAEHHGQVLESQFSAQISLALRIPQRHQGVFLEVLASLNLQAMEKPAQDGVA